MKELDLLDIKLGVLQNTVDAKKGKSHPFTQEEKEKMENLILQISSELSEILGDSQVEEQIKQDLLYETRKQMVKIGKVIDQLRMTVKISKEVLEK